MERIEESEPELESVKYPPFCKKDEVDTEDAVREAKVNEIFEEIKTSILKSDMYNGYNGYNNVLLYNLKFTKLNLEDLCVSNRLWENGNYVNIITISIKTLETHTYSFIRELLLHTIIHSIIGSYHYHDLVWKNLITINGGNCKLRCRDNDFDYKRYLYIHCCSNKLCYNSYSRMCLKIGKSKNCDYCKSPWVYIKSS